MGLAKAYEEIVDFIAAGSSPQNVIAFRPSSETRHRVWELVEREKSGNLSEEESSELAQYLQLEHIMRLAKARAQSFAQATKT
ncbi:MAG: hypothetical protein AAF560_08915 [Acidobacteriota bacterium]